MTDLRTMARALGGEVSGRAVLCPGPGHSARDRSLSVMPSSSAPDGFVVWSHSGDDPLAAKDYVRQRLGVPAEFSAERNQAVRSRTQNCVAPSDRTARALDLWNEARTPIDSPVERYLAGRGLDLPDEAREVIRFHPSCPFAGTRTRAKGPRVPLPGPVGSDTFLTAYQEALAGRTVKARAGRPSTAPGTIEALIQSYKKSADYIGLRETTKAGYRRRLEMIRVHHGHRTVAGLTHGRIVKAFLDPLAEKPGAALDTLKKLRILIRRAIVLGWLASDPSVAIRRPKIGEIRSWTDEEIAQFEARWPIGSKRRLAFALELFTGQRRSDVHRMTWADVKGERIRVVQQKTGAKIDIPLHAELRAVLAEAPREHATILNTEYGRPFTVDGFSGFMRDSITAAGLPLDAKPHGLRKAAGRRLAEAGCTAHEIMAVLGHSTLAEAERYTREANRAHLSTGAITKLEGWKGNKPAQTTS